MSEYNYNDGEVELMAAEMLSVERTPEQAAVLAMDKQTAEHLYNTGDYLGVIKHIGSMFGLSEEEAIVMPECLDLQRHADACMKAAGI